MPPCEPMQEWTMFLVLDKYKSEVETLAFELNITDGEITGRVTTSEPKVMSEITGRCKPVTLLPTLPDLPVMANMNFIFRLRKKGIERAVHLSGIACYPSAGRPIFEGSVLVFEPNDSHVPPGGPGETQELSSAGDPGDTGTGTGTQT